jgi:3-dehydroquinate synthase
MYTFTAISTQLCIGIFQSLSTIYPPASGAEIAYFRSMASTRILSVAQIGSFLAERPEPGACMVLADENTYRSALPLLPELHTFPCMVIPAGEASKSLQNAEKLLQHLLSHGLSRNATLLNLGGGVVCDLGGFAASIYKRGIAYINIPTSLMAMVDAAIGGKTAVNLGPHRNMVGSFHHPLALVLEPDFLRTLPQHELRSARAEMLKHALLQGSEAWLRFQADAPDALPDASRILEHLQFKQAVVASDPHDRGLRQNLNLGHTVAHALEAWFLKIEQEIPHGDAVASGLWVELQLALLLQTGISAAWAHEVQDLIRAQFPRIPLAADAIDPVLHYMQGDKKNDRQLRFVLLRGPGDVLHNQSATPQQVAQCLNDYRNA